MHIADAATSFARAAGEKACEPGTERLYKCVLPAGETEGVGEWQFDEDCAAVQRNLPVKVGLPTP